MKSRFGGEQRDHFLVWHINNPWDGFYNFQQFSTRISMVLCNVYGKVAFLKNNFF